MLVTAQVQQAEKVWAWVPFKLEFRFDTLLHICIHVYVYIHIYMCVSFGLDRRMATGSQMSFRVKLMGTLKIVNFKNSL